MHPHNFTVIVGKYRLTLRILDDDKRDDSLFSYLCLCIVLFLLIIDNDANHS